MKPHSDEIVAVGMLVIITALVILLGFGFI